MSLIPCTSQCVYQQDGVCTLDSAAAGLGAGFSDFPLVPTLLAVFLAGAAAVRLGCALGTLLSRRVNLELSWVSGVMLIMLAVGKLL